MAARTMSWIRTLSGSIAAVCLCALPAFAAALPNPLPNTLPNTLQPAIAAPGGSIRVVAAEAGLPIALSGPMDIALEAAWTANPADGVHAQCVIPADTPPGRYGLSVGDETREGAVWVLEELPASYRLAFAAGDSSADIAGVLAAAESAEVLALVFIADGGDTDAYSQIFTEAPLPVIVTGVGRPVDTPFPFATAIGQDTLLFHDPRVTRLGAADGDLHRLRRATRASRWSIAVWPLYDPFLGRRAQLILFSDDPVDLFVAPLEEIPERLEDAPLPGFWPRVRFEPLTAGAADTLLVLEVTPATLRPARIPLQASEPPRTNRNSQRNRKRVNNGVNNGD